MEAVFNNLYDQIPDAAITPHEVIHAFIKRWDPGRVGELLWELFALAALAGLGERSVVFKKAVTAEELASLLDQLVALVRAASALHQASGAPYPVMQNGGQAHA
ncbi:hypothetical protein DYU05_05815 [Mucilaginibacter terrenus]|uniref:Uncharacterized protein n=1 Tax=Mucilaginibacter terrenus TaxID=2482727 RepID=A0A3E2NVS6_9SPHI|nr:hypothetical protein [Mucilaginibacter terrenus]RFZ85118.1 hypothetical protein DYU05_05815 [Mucilaginibacter terrenus]